MASHRVFVTDNQALNTSDCVRILPIPYDLTTSFLSGARFGPNAILNASPYLEFFDDELEWDVSQHVKFVVEEDLLPEASGPADMMAKVRDTASKLLESGDFILALGGEHSLTAPLVQVYKQYYNNLHVVQIDAHCDLRDTYQNSPHSHACAMRRVTELGIPLTQIGIRNFSEEESIYLNAESKPPIHIWKAEKLKQSDCWNQLLIYLKNTLDGPVYLTIDVDGLDPSVVPATGTPEPGGLSWYETVEIVKTICMNHDVIGADVMELAPIPGLTYAEFAVAKLCYKVLSYIFYRKRKYSI